MPNTLTPFLNHTKTLSRLARAASTTSLRAGLHTTPRRGVGYSRNNDIPFELPPDLERDLPGSSTFESEARDSLTPNEREIFTSIFTEIQRTGKKPRILTSADLRPAAPPPAAAAAAIVQDTPPPGASPFLTGLIGGPAEGGGGVAADKPPAPPKPAQPMDPVKAALTVNAIMQDAAHQYSGAAPGLRGLEPTSPLEATRAAAEREKALLKFPPTLRRAARHAFGMFDPFAPLVQTEGGGQEAVGTVAPGGAAPGVRQQQQQQQPAAQAAVGSGRSREKLVREVQMEATRREARMTIRNRMEACADDFEVWKVMEEHVFTLVAKLGINDIAENVAVEPFQAEIKRGKRKKNLATVDAEAAKAVAEAKAAAKAAAASLKKADLDMETYGPMYPQLLLDGLNILGTRFARPSPYILHLLPRIKELGLVSYVLGVSTAFYNRLILILWNRYGDATAVLNMLEEMRHAGLYFDEDSLSVVSRIEAAYSETDRGERGYFAQLLMGMPEFEPILAKRLRHWVGQIIANIKEREL